MIAICNALQIGKETFIVLFHNLERFLLLLPLRLFLKRLVVIHDRNILQRLFKQKINQFISRTIRLCGKVIQLGQRFFAHTHRHHFVPVLSLLSADKNLPLHALTS